jgi:long-subunit fatty acid transport protein
MAVDGPERWQTVTAYAADKVWLLDATSKRLDWSEAKRLKALEDENAKLKKLLAEQMLDVAALRELLGKNGTACRQA